MTDQKETILLAGLDERVTELQRRVDRLEEDQTALNRLATAVEVLATRQESMSATLEHLNEKVSVLEAKPAKRWDVLMDKLLCAAAGAVLAWMMSGGGV